MRTRSMKAASRRAASILMLWVASSAPTLAGDTPSRADPALVDSIVEKLESSGALDAAVERAIDRYVARKEQAQRAEYERKAAELAKSVPAVDPESDHIRGHATAEVSLIEYSDLECPFCKQFHATPKALLERYGGRVNWVMRNFPLPIHGAAARNEALAAECVAVLGGNQAYWKFVDAVFAQTRSNGNGLPEEHSVGKLASEAGVSGPAFTRCIADPATARRVDLDIANATKAGVTGTPTTVVRNNRTGAAEALVGAVPADVIAQKIGRLLAAQSQSSVTTGK